MVYFGARISENCSGSSNLKKDLLNKFVLLLRLNFKKNPSPKFVQIYAPNTISDDSEIEEFYDGLESILTGSHLYGVTSVQKLSAERKPKRGTLIGTAVVRGTTRIVERQQWWR